MGATHRILDPDTVANAELELHQGSADHLVEGSAESLTDAHAFEREQIYHLLRRDPDFSDTVLAFELASKFSFALGPDNGKLVDRVANSLGNNRGFSTFGRPQARARRRQFDAGLLV